MGEPVAMDDDVEMEFISVMGVLVPIDVTEGVSKEAKRFASGDVSAEEKVDTNQVTNDYFSRVDSDHTETKCNELSPTLEKCTKDDSELRLLKWNQQNKRKRQELVQMQEQYAEPRKRKKNVTESMAEAEDNFLLVEKQLQNYSKKQSYRTPAVKRKSSEAKLKSVSDCTSSVEILDQTTDEKLVEENSIYPSSTFSSTAPTELSPITGNGKRPFKRSRYTNDEVVKQRKTAATPRSRITGTCKLESDDEEQRTKKVQKSNTFQTCKTRSSSDQRQCAYPQCIQSVRYKSRCAKHNTRSRCSLPDCTKFAHTGGKCIAHGGGSRCTKTGCSRRARSQGKCYCHGGCILCSHPKCTTRAKSKGKCVAHGGGTVCSERGCNKLVTANGKCIAHGGWINCSNPGCDKRSQLRGKCYEHSKSDAPVLEGKKAITRRSTAKASTLTSDDNPTMQLRRVLVNPGDIEKERGSKPLYQRAKQAMIKTANAEFYGKELEERTMSLRSWQRINLVTRSLVNGEMFEEDALQLALKLSEIEY